MIEHNRSFWRVLTVGMVLCCCSCGSDEPSESAGMPSAGTKAGGAGGKAGRAAGGSAAGGEPAAMSGDESAGCPVHVSVTTMTYGTGNEDDDDYAPNNVGAIWVTDESGTFVRTVTAWGPNYWNYAATWVKESKGSRVDITTSATRKSHLTPVAADWDCRDSARTLVAAGGYRMNVEFTEAEHQGPLLSGDTALSFRVGTDARGSERQPSGMFGAVTVSVTEP
jgi:hypothetical protein